MISFKFSKRFESCTYLIRRHLAVWMVPSRSLALAVRVAFTTRLLSLRFVGLVGLMVGAVVKCVMLAWYYIALLVLHIILYPDIRIAIF